MLKVFIRPNVDCCEGLEETLQLDNFVQQSLLNCDTIDIFVCEGVLCNIRSWCISFTELSVSVTFGGYFRD